MKPPMPIFSTVCCAAAARPMVALFAAFLLATAGCARPADDDAAERLVAAAAQPACAPVEPIEPACTAPMQAPPVAEEAVTDAPGRNEDPALRLVFYTDVQATTDWGVPEAMTAAADAVNAEQPDLVIAGGDLILGGFTSTPEEARARWEVYALLRDRIEAPVYAAIGNHDLVDVAAATEAGEDPRSAFLRHADRERTYYSFDVEGYHFIVLDTVQIVGGQLGYEGGIDQPQREWLIADLAAVGAATPVVLVTHMPLLSAYPAATGGWLEVPPASRVVLNANELLDLFEGHELRLVLQGHLHVFESIEWRGTKFVTGGAISGNWWKGARLGTEEGYCVIELTRDAVDVRYRSYAWESRRRD